MAKLLLMPLSVKQLLALQKMAKLSETSLALLLLNEITLT